MQLNQSIYNRVKLLLSKNQQKYSMQQIKMNPQTYDDINTDHAYQTKIEADNKEMGIHSNAQHLQQHKQKSSQQNNLAQQNNCLKQRQLQKNPEISEMKALKSQQKQQQVGQIVYKKLIHQGDQPKFQQKQQTVGDDIAQNSGQFKNNKKQTHANQLLNQQRLQQFKKQELELANIEYMSMKAENIQNEFLDQQKQEQHNIQTKNKQFITQQIRQSTEFNWGEQQDTDQQEIKNKNKQLYKIKMNAGDLFIDSELSNIANKIKNQNSQLSRKVPKQDIDIWKDLRQSMLVKSRANLSKKQAGNLNKKQRKSILYQNIDLNSNKSKLHLGSSQQNKKIANKQLDEEMNSLQNIKKINQAISQKMKKWRKQQRQTQLSRNHKINIQSQKLVIDERHKIQEQVKKRVQFKQKRVKAITQRLSLKNKSKKKVQNSVNKVNEKAKVGVKKSKTQKSYKIPKQIQVSKSSQNINVNERSKQIFSVHWNRKDKQIKDEKQKYLRRKFFQQKVKQIPINVSQDKKLQILVGIDKSLNPLKYQLLHKKGLNDKQIYQNSELYREPEDPKKIGVRYLQDLRQKNKIEDLRRYMSQQNLISLKKYERSWKSPNLGKYAKNHEVQAINYAPLTNSIKEISRHKEQKLLAEDQWYLKSLKRRI